MSIILVLVVSLAFTIPAVQTGVARWGTDKASEWLGAKVSLSKLGITFPLTISIDDFYVEDYQRDTMIYVRHIDVPVKMIVPRPLVLHFGEVQLYDGGFTLHENELDSLNIKEIVNRIKSARNGGERADFRLEIDGIRGSNIYYNQFLNLGEYDSPIDYGNMIIRLDTISLEEFKVINDSVRMSLRTASFTERSGFRVDTLRSDALTVHQGKVLLDDVGIINSDTRMILPAVHLVGHDWDTYQHYIDSVRTHVVARNSTISTRSLAYFSNVFKDMDLVASNLNCSTDNPLRRYEGEVNSANIEGVGLVAHFTSKGLPDFPTTIWNLTIESANADAAAIQSLVKGVTQNELPASVVKLLATQGRMRLGGKLKGSMEDFSSDINLSTLSGVAHIHAAMKKQRNGGYHTDYSISTTDFSLGRLLSTPKMGRISIEASLNGALTTEGFDADYNLCVDSIRLLDYTYKAIAAEGTIDRRRIDARVIPTKKDHEVFF